MYSLNCFHGAFAHAAISIKLNGFESSSGEKDWLGKGVYFFESCNSSKYGIDNAKKWIYKKWNKTNRIVNRYSILKSLIEVENEYLLDLTIPSQFEYFQIFRQEYIAEQCRRGLNIKFPRDGVELDSIILRNICNKIRVDVARKYDYIRFPRDVRLGINSRMPNSIIVCVKKNECIKETSIEEEGDIDVRSKEYL